MLCSWVQQVCFAPPMVSVSVAKGRAIMPLISESRQFALCQVGKDDSMLVRKFGNQPDLGDDPFLGQQLGTGATEYDGLWVHGRTIKQSTASALSWSHVAWAAAWSANGPARRR